MSTKPATVERLPKSRVVCTLMFTADEVKNAEETALKHLSENVNIKGFRVGHAPAEMVRLRFSEEKILEETVRSLMRTEMATLVETHAIHPVIPPKIEIVTKDPLTVKITFVEKPKVAMKNIDTLKVTKKEVKIDEKEVQKVVDSVLNDYRTATDVERPAQKHDRLTMDFSATDTEGKTIEGLSAADYQTLIGNQTLLPGFEDELMGLKKNETKKFTLKLPEKFQVESLRGKPATFSVTVKRIEETKLPELTDSFAKEKLNSETAEAFKKWSSSR